MPILCEPGSSYSPDSCWDTAHCVKDDVDFGSPNAFANIAEYKGDPSKTAFVSQFEPSNAKVNNGELEMTLVKQGDGKGFGATVINTRAIQYGTITAVMRSGCTSGGVVSSFIVRSDKTGDEIDFEWVGKDTSNVQSNYYWHDQLDYTKMVASPSLPDTTKNFHTYQINWTPDQIVWLINGKAFRTVKRADTWDASAKAFKYPDSEAYVSFSIWDGGSMAKGTSDWAGGRIDWAKGPFVAAVKSVKIDCFYKGNETTYTPPGGNSGDNDNSSKDDDSSSKDGDNDDSSKDEDNNSSKGDDDGKSSKGNEDSSVGEQTGEQTGDQSDGDESSSEEPSSDQTDATDTTSGARSLVASVSAAAISALLAAYAF